METKLLFFLMDGISNQTQSHPSDDLNVYLNQITHTDTQLNFQTIWKAVIHQWLLDNGARRRPRLHRAEAERKQSCRCCRTGETGLRRAKRQREGKWEQHWAISSQSGCTGLMGEGKSLTRAAFLSGWQDGTTEEMRNVSPLLIPLTTKSTPEWYLNLIWCAI